MVSCYRYLQLVCILVFFILACSVFPYNRSYVCTVSLQCIPSLSSICSISFNYCTVCASYGSVGRVLRLVTERLFHPPQVGGSCAPSRLWAVCAAARCCCSRRPSCSSVWAAAPPNGSTARTSAGRPGSAA